MKKIIVSFLVLFNFVIFGKPTEDPVFGLEFKKRYFGPWSYWEGLITIKEIPGLPGNIFPSEYLTTGERLKKIYKEEIRSRFRCSRLSFFEGHAQMKLDGSQIVCSPSLERLQFYMSEVLENKKMSLKASGQKLKECDFLSQIEWFRKKHLEDQFSLLALRLKVIDYALDKDCHISDEMLGYMAIHLLKNKETVEYHGVGCSFKMTVFDKKDLEDPEIDLSKFRARRP